MKLRPADLSSNVISVLSIYRPGSGPMKYRKWARSLLGSRPNKETSAEIRMSIALQKFDRDLGFLAGVLTVMPLFRF